MLHNIAYLLFICKIIILFIEIVISDIFLNVFFLHNMHSFIYSVIDQKWEINLHINRGQNVLWFMMSIP